VEISVSKLDCHGSNSVKNAEHEIGLQFEKVKCRTRLTIPLTGSTIIYSRKW
jgi:hypothetical protein